jgi:AbrB family looped-hinge helix DNA binding protein
MLWLMTILTVQGRGTLTLPAELRRRLGIERGTQVELIERADGVVELRPVITVPADQAWFWTERWQRMEREVDEHVERGEVTRSGDIDEMFADVDRRR